MRERPIIYTAESIRAILDGRKTQTRRVIIPQPIRLDTNAPGGSWFWSRHCDTFGDTAEILRQAAADDWQKRQVAGLILISRDWCWKDFLRLHHPLQGWAMDVLRQWQHCPEEGEE